MRCFERCISIFNDAIFVTMFQKIAKHRANDASLTMHRPPLLLSAILLLVMVSSLPQCTDG